MNFEIEKLRALGHYNYMKPQTGSASVDQGNFFCIFIKELYMSDLGLNLLSAIRSELCLHLNMLNSLCCFGGFRVVIY